MAKRDTKRRDWPVLRTYEGEALNEIAMPLGGIGTGTISLSGRGHLRDFEVRDHPDKGFTPERCFFALWTKQGKDEPVTRCLEGPIPVHLHGGGQSGCYAPNHGLPRFEHCRFDAAYPLAQVHLTDRQVPVDVRLEAFNPMVPADADASGWPVASLRFVLRNTSRQPVEASVCGSLANFIARGVEDAKPVNAERDAGGLRGLNFSANGLDKHSPDRGTLALATTAKRGVSVKPMWATRQWGGAPLEFWDDFAHDGRLEPVDQPEESVGSVAVKLRLKPREQREVTFLIAWHFPNRRSWTKPDGSTGEYPQAEDGRVIVGNYYTERFADAWDAASQFARQSDPLEQRTVRFVDALVSSDLPAEAVEAALFNASTLRTQTAFRTPDGRLFGYEGCGKTWGCCPGSCTHVWNYEQATGLLYGELSKTMREVEFRFATDAQGFQSFRKNLPLELDDWHVAAADGQMGSIMRLYRDWRWSGDERMLADLWPAARKALEFCWVEGGWDADRDGVMEGCQHNTMDVEYFGPNPEVGVWYLGALRAGEEMARHLGDDDFADQCRRLFDSGSAWLDEHLFNGEYYEHDVRPIRRKTQIVEGLLAGMGADMLEEPKFQIGRGCIADQLVGQVMAHVAGLGHLLKPAHIRKALRSIMRYNYRRSLADHFNNMRSYALGDEGGVLVCSYPRGERPAQPFPYFAEVWTGIEYTAAANMLYENMPREAMKIIRTVRDRHDGRRRNPFDEPECGHHYARAMASWAAIPALTGYDYSARDKRVRFADAGAHAVWFWSSGYAFGTFEQKPGRSGTKVTLEVIEGELPLKTLALAGVGEAELDRPTTVRAGEQVTATL